MKILHLRSSGGFYGAESVILNLSCSLNANGVESYICCINNQKNPHIELVERAKEYGIEAFSVLCNGLLDFQAVKSIRDLIVQKNIDALHCHDYKADILGVWACRRLNIKRITTNHLWTHANLKLRLYELIDGLVLNQFHKVIAVSDQIAEEISPFLWNKNKLEIIYNGISMNQDVTKNSRQEIIADLGIPKNSKIVGAVGRLSSQKGFNYLIEAAKQVLDKIPNVSFLIIGDGPSHIELSQKAKSLNVDKNIVFAGIRTDMGDMYNLMDIFVLSSIAEGLPIVVLEAMAMQKPVVATDVGSVSKLVENDKTGILVKAKDAKALALAIIFLLNNQEKAESLAVQGRKLVEEKFSSEIMAKQYKLVYESVLN